MNYKQKPLYEALKKHHNDLPISFHVPGHKYGQVFPEEETDFFKEILKIDATEISGLDDLHAPETVILESEKLLAELYEVKKSYFLVNGTTVGNLAMVMATCKENETVLVQRNSHKSIMNALKLAKAQPVFLEPVLEETWGVAGGIDLETVSQALHQYPHAKAIILTYPNYYGMTYDIKTIIELAHEKGIAVLVDEAHGAHFALTKHFPLSATSLGADIVVQSAHKTLPAMTMGSYLHFNSELVSLEKITEYLQILQSSSPSYPIMASLDLARSYLATFDEADCDYIINEINEFKDKLNTIDGIKIQNFREGHLDPLKVTVASTVGLSGFEMQKQFEAVGIYTEMADANNVVFVLPLLKKNDFSFFKEALKRIRTVDFYNTESKRPLLLLPNNKQPIKELQLSYKQMDDLSVVALVIENAVGKISAETIIPYPPGIPLILPGERLTIETLSYLQDLIKIGSRFHGGGNLETGHIKVYLTDQ